MICTYCRKEDIEVHRLDFGEWRDVMCAQCALPKVHAAGRLPRWIDINGIERWRRDVYLGRLVWATWQPDLYHNCKRHTWLSTFGRPSAAGLRKYDESYSGWTACATLFNGPINPHDPKFSLK